MIKAKLVDTRTGKVVEKLMWMRRVWEEPREATHDGLDLEISTNLLDTEKEWLEKLMKWTYKSREGTIKVNGETYDVRGFLNV